MKHYLNGFLIVEGQADKAFLSSFLDCEIVITNGFVIARETIDYINELSKRYTPLIMCDNDKAGETIKNKVLDLVPTAIVITTNFKNRGNYSKQGIAETSKEEILKALKPYIITTPYKVGNLMVKDLLEFELNNAKRRDFLQKQLNIGTCNLKTTLKRLNLLNIDKSIIKKVMNDYDNR